MPTLLGALQFLTICLSLAQVVLGFSPSAREEKVECVVRSQVGGCGEGGATLGLWSVRVCREQGRLRVCS